MTRWTATPGYGYAPSTAMARPYEFEGEELLAVCVQHELDHLSGKVFVEYLVAAQAQPHQDQAGQAPARRARRLMAARMKVAFAGTPEFARVALAAILAARASTCPWCSPSPTALPAAA